jgi:hypothetical protein
MPSKLVLSCISNHEVRPNVFYVLLLNNICGVVQIIRMDEDDDSSRFIEGNGAIKDNGPS